MLFLSENLKKYRILKNLTQEEVAQYLNITPKAFQNGSEGVPKLKDTTLKTHACITSKQQILEVKPL